MCVYFYKARVCTQPTYIAAKNPETKPRWLTVGSEITVFTSHVKLFHLTTNEKQPALVCKRVPKGGGALRSAAKHVPSLAASERNCRPIATLWPKHYRLHKRCNLVTNVVQCRKSVYTDVYFIVQRIRVILDLTKLTPGNWKLFTRKSRSLFE